MRIKLTSIMVDHQDKALQVLHRGPRDLGKNTTFRLANTDGSRLPHRKALTTWSSPSNRMPIRPVRRFRKRCSHKGFRSPPSR